MVRDSIVAVHKEKGRCQNEDTRHQFPASCRFLVLAFGLKTPSLRSQPTVMGQTATLLPNGSWLVLGGMGPAGPRNGALIRDPDSDQAIQISGSLKFARAWHAATVLPDGTVLIMGGIGVDGKIVASAELFDPASRTFSSSTPFPHSPRAFQTAILLTNGTVLIAGGRSVDGVVLATAEIWNPQTKTVTRLREGSRCHAKNIRRRFLQTVESFCGAVLTMRARRFKAGISTIQSTESFTAIDRFPTELQNVNAGPLVAGSIPEDGAQNVPMSALLAVRFSVPLKVQTVNIVTATLQGPEGLVSTTVVPAEGGALTLLHSPNAAASRHGLSPSAERPLGYCKSCAPTDPNRVHHGWVTVPRRRNVAP